MTTKVLTENQISGMKENGVTVIVNGCEVEAAKDKTLPTTAWLIVCKNEEKQWSDIVMGTRVAVFDSYYMHLVKMLFKEWIGHLELSTLFHGMWLLNHQQRKREE